MVESVLANVGIVPDMDDFQFELDGYRWGLHCPISTDASGFDPGNNAWLTQDQNSSLNGANMMGRDVRQAQTWSWTLHVDHLDEVGALAELAAMGANWNNGATGYRDSRTVRMLRYRVAGRTRVIFGRPRSLDYQPDNRILSGYLQPSATFAKADALHYDDAEQSVDMYLGSTAAGGFEWPATFPLTFTLDEDVVPPWAMVVGGDAPTAPIIEFTGPVTNPAVQIGTFKLAFVGELAEGGKITVDTRPWSPRVLRTGNTADCKLTASSRLNARLVPGAYDAVFTGVDNTGLATCRVLWRNAWHTL